MKVRRKIATALAVAMALTSVRAGITTLEVHADVENTTQPSEVISTDEKPKVGDQIWITDEKITCYGSDGMFEAIFSSNSQYKIYIVGQYDDEHWRVHVPMLNEPERVLLIPVDVYNIEVISHDNYVLGDLNRDNRVDVFDLVLLKRIVIDDYDFNLYDYKDIPGMMDRAIDRQVADINSDAEVSVADVVCMQQFILGSRKTYRD